MKSYKIIFSPTGGTSRVADAITRSWTDTELIDLSSESYPTVLEANSLALIAMPSFGGIAPQLALDRLARIQGNHSKCVIAAVYGNRAYEDTLLQMKDYAQQAQFQVIAAISAVAEHSIVHAFANGRPNADDCRELNDFGKKVLDLASKEVSSISVPGNKPYKKAGSAMVPKAGRSCTSCGLCAKNCPAGAIDPANPRTADKTRCIGCMRCVSLCPSHARGLNPVMVKIAGMALKKACSVPKENQLIL